MTRGRRSYTQTESAKRPPGVLARLGARISYIADRLGGRKKLAALSGVSESQLYRYISSNSQPTVDPLVAIANAGNISIRWLATGEGPYLAEDAEAAPSTPPTPHPSPPAHAEPPPPSDPLAPLAGSQDFRMGEGNTIYGATARGIDDFTRIERSRLLQRLELGQMPLLAVAGRQRTTWHVLNALYATSPQPLSAEEIASMLKQQGVTLELREIATELAMLKARCYVASDPSSGTLVRFRPTTKSMHVSAKEVADAAQLHGEALIQLANGIIQRIESDPTSGSVTLISLTVPSSSGKDVIARIRQAVKDTCIAEATDDGDDVVSVVFGIAQQESEKRGSSSTPSN